MDRLEQKLQEWNQKYAKRTRWFMAGFVILVVSSGITYEILRLVA